MNSTMVFNNDSINTIYTLQNTSDIFYLTIPNNLMKNFQTFIKLRKEDNQKKGISDIRNETPIRKQLLEDVQKVNILIKDLNNKYVYSKINKLPELPIDELEDVLNPNNIFDLDKYMQITKKIEDNINEAFKLMTSSNIKKESMEQVLLLVNEKEPDKDFVKWLTLALPMIKSPTTLEELKKIYKKSKIRYSLANYQTIITKDERKFIAGLDIDKVPYVVNIPFNINIEQLFQNEIISMPIEKFENKSETEISTIIFSNICLHYQKEKMELNNNHLISEKSNISIEADKLLVERENLTKKEITKNTVEDDIERISSSDEVTNKNEVILSTDNNAVKNEYDNVIDLNNTMTKPKVRVLTRPKNNNAAFIKFGTILLFSLSFILIIISVVLLIIK